MLANGEAGEGGHLFYHHHLERTVMKLIFEKHVCAEAERIRGFRLIGRNEEVLPVLYRLCPVVSHVAIPFVK
jgi:hypothetical protein